MMKLALVSAALWLGGCAGSIDPGSLGTDSGLVQMRQIEHLPGCDARRGTTGALSARPIAGVADLFAVYRYGVGLCIDSQEGIAANLGTDVAYAASNPMPGVDPANSNPMPGVDPANSNPMPGSDPANSNPMPGSDPASSNPMPGSDPASSNPMPGSSKR